MMKMFDDLCNQGCKAYPLPLYSATIVHPPPPLNSPSTVANRSTVLGWIDTILLGMLDSPYRQRKNLSTAGENLIKKTPSLLAILPLCPWTKPFKRERTMVVESLRSKIWSRSKAAHTSTALLYMLRPSFIAINHIRIVSRQ